MLTSLDLTFPTHPSSLADAVVVAVRDAVSAGQLVPGEIYSVYQLAELLGVSRSPVREAITRLADAGLVQIARNRGFQVVVPSARDVDEIIDIRIVLEGMAVRRAAEYSTEAQLAHLREALKVMEVAARVNDEAAFWPADRALHDALLQAAGNARAAGVVGQLRATLALLGPPTTACGRTLAQIYAEHVPVVTAVIARDGVTAEREMRAHLEATGRLLRTQCSTPAHPN